MKNYFFLFAMLALTLVACAQNKNVNKASRFTDMGRLAEAEEFINMAIENEKTMDKAKTWHTYGEVYNAILNDSTYESEKDALAEAAKGYRKAMELENNETAPYYFMSSQAIENLWGGHLNDGVTYYQEGQLDKALEELELCAVVKPEDTTAYLYAASIALEKSDFEKAIEYYNELIDLDYTTPSIYNGYIFALGRTEAPQEKILETIQQGLAEFPGNVELLRQQVQFYLDAGRKQEAITSLQETIEKDPENPMLYFNLGFLYDEAEDKEKAIEYYEKSLEYQEDFFEPLFNIGVIYYNMGTKKINEANSLTLTEYRKNGKALEEEGKVFFKQAMPYLEKAAEIRQEDLVTLETLQSIYFRLQENEKAAELGEKIKELGGNSN